MVLQFLQENQTQVDMCDSHVFVQLQDCLKVRNGISMSEKSGKQKTSAKYMHRCCFWSQSC